MPRVAIDWSPVLLENARRVFCRNCRAWVVLAFCMDSVSCSRCNGRQSLVLNLTERRQYHVGVSKRGRLDHKTWNDSIHAVEFQEYEETKEL